MLRFHRQGGWLVLRLSFCPPSLLISVLAVEIDACRSPSFFSYLKCLPRCVSALHGGGGAYSFDLQCLVLWFSGSPSLMQLCEKDSSLQAPLLDISILPTSRYCFPLWPAALRCSMPLAGLGHLCSVKLCSGKGRGHKR